MFMNQFHVFPSMTSVVVPFNYFVYQAPSDRFVCSTR